MKIGIIDAELITKQRHRFPNLCSMKISAYHKSRGDDVVLLMSYSNLEDFDKIYISKVFSDTVVPEDVLTQPNVLYGGTGFFYDNAEPLPPEIEHIMPDYHLYDDWVYQQIARGIKKSNFIYFTEYSIGFLTRGCFRKCPFCVNRRFDRPYIASSLEEFVDNSRPKICFLDDNFFAFPRWKELINQVSKLQKRFQFKQGLDERLLDKDKILEIATWPYDKEMIFAFDNIEDKDLIVSKLKMIAELVPNWKRNKKFYVLCGYDKNNVYDMTFWEQDIKNLFERIDILAAYNCKPYVMRYKAVYASRYKGFYSVVASWCNQPNIFKTFSFREFAQCRGMCKNGYKIYKRDTASYLNNIGIKGSTWLYMEEVEKQLPNISQLYFDKHYN